MSTVLGPQDSMPVDVRSVAEGGRRLLGI